MNRRAAQIGFFVALAATGFVHSSPKFGASHRCQALLETDNNADESLRNARIAPSLRLMLHTKAYLRRESTLLLGAFQSGGQFYPDYAIENKMINELSASAVAPLSSHLKLLLEGSVRSKLFFQRDIDYLLARSGSSLTFPFCGFDLRIGLEWESLNYFSSQIFDATTPSFHFEFSRRFGEAIILRPSYTAGRRQYPRPVVSRTLALDGDQSDGVRIITLQLDGLYGGMLLNLTLRREHNRSNSYGFSYSRNTITLLFAAEIGRVLIRCYGQGGRKQYLDDLLPFQPLELDVEREESNYLVIDLSHDFSSSHTILLRAAWYRNESPWASLYYEKILFNLGLEFRFKSF